ncbi:MAG: hypothetical protein LBV00_06470 [Propionibacteriaceae bacterium]|jgi:hypothetical protein|nr:hypothetical protein [Propionibacteriaceae bacterium]
MLVLIIINAIIGVGTAGMAVVSVIKPQLFSRSESVTSGEVHYTRMYAARAVPLGLAAGLLPFWWSGAPVVTLLLVAAVAQVIDVVLNIRSREMGLLIGATVAATVHIVAAVAIGMMSLA